MKYLLTICGVLFTVLTALTPLQTKAAESDTHFRAAYVKARLYGISHEYALFMAKYSQGVDESLLSSAFLFSNQRLMHHFHGDTSPTEERKPGILGGLKAVLKAHLALAERNHALANAFLWMGLKLGSPRLFAWGLHHLTDSYWHAGFSNGWGHMENDHGPDDTSKDTAKYNSYVRGFGEAMKAARNSAGAWGTNYSDAIKLLSPVARKYHDFQRDLTPEDFQNTTFISDLVVKYEDLQNLHMKDIQKDPAYKRTAYKKVWDSYVRNGIMESNVKFEDFFPSEIVENRDVTVEKGVQLTMRQEILKMYHGEPSFINLDLAANQNSKMVLYLKDQINVKKLAVETNRYTTRLLSYLNLQDAATKAKTLLDGNTNTQIEEQASNRVAQFEIEEGELLAALDPEVKRTIIDDLALLREYSRLNGGTVDAWTLYVGRETKFPEGATADDVGNAFYNVNNLANDLGASQKAAQISISFCKDFVPVKFNSWVKTQFALNGDMRETEVMMKDEIYRRFIQDKFGYNFVNEKRNLAIDMITLGGKFKRAIKKTSGSNYTEFQKIALERVEEIARLQGWKSSHRDNADTVAYSWRSRFKIPLLLAPVTVVTFPIIVSSLVFRKIIDWAYKNAKEYQTMDGEDFKKAQNEKRLKVFNKNEVLKGILVKSAAKIARLQCFRAQKAR